VTGILVTGCHRSGTSALSGVLSKVFGVIRSQDIPLSPDNPKGYNESQALRNLNDGILKLNGSTWDTPPIAPLHAHHNYSSSIEIARHTIEFQQTTLYQNWVDKDPRLCVTLPIVTSLSRIKPRIILALRDPYSVALSLRHRNGFSVDKGLLIWWIYNRSASRYLNSANDYIFSYELILKHQNSCFRSLLDYLNKDAALSASNLELSFNSVFDQSLWHWQPDLITSDDKDLGGELGEFLGSIYRKLITSCCDLTLFRRLFDSVPPFIMDRYDAILSGPPYTEEFSRLSSLLSDPFPQGNTLSSTLSDLCISLTRLSNDIYTHTNFELPRRYWSLSAASVEFHLRFWFSAAPDLLPYLWSSEYGRETLRVLQSTRSSDFWGSFDYLRMHNLILARLSHLNTLTDPIAWQLLIGLFIITPPDKGFKIINAHDSLPPWLFEIHQTLFVDFEE